MPIEMIEEFNMGTQIKVIGVGGGGGNAVEHMIARASGRRVHLRQHRRAGAEPLERAHSADPARHTGLGAGSQARGRQGLGRGGDRPHPRGDRRRAHGVHHRRHGRRHRHRRGAGDRARGQGDGHPHRRRGHQAVRVRGQPPHEGGRRRRRRARSERRFADRDPEREAARGAGRRRHAGRRRSRTPTTCCKNAVGGISDIIHMPAPRQRRLRGREDGDERARQGDDGHGDGGRARTAR